MICFFSLSFGLQGPSVLVSKLCAKALLHPASGSRSLVDFPRGEAPSHRKDVTCTSENIGGPQKGPAERGHVKKRQKSSKIFSTLFDIFRVGQKTSKIVKILKVSKIFSTLFDNFRAAPVFRPLSGGSENNVAAQDFSHLNYKAKATEISGVWRCFHSGACCCGPCVFLRTSHKGCPDQFVISSLG